MGNKGKWENNDNLGYTLFLKPYNTFLHSNPTAISLIKEGFPLGFLRQTYHEPITFIFQKPSTSGGCEPTCKFVRRGGEFMCS